MDFRCKDLVLFCEAEAEFFMLSECFEVIRSRGKFRVEPSALRNPAKLHIVATQEYYSYHMRSITLSGE